MYTYLSNLATLAFDVEEDIRLPTFSRVAGTGFFKKEGAGYLDMSQTDSSDFTGTVNIIDGTMNIGSLGADSKINVGSGATMEGGGKVGSVEVSVGGTLYQGASSVALHISGDYIQRGGTYRVQVGPQFKPVTVSGKTSITGTLDVAVHTDADMADTYIVLRSATTVVGQFAVKEDETVFSNIILLPGTRNVGVHYALKSKPVYHEYVQGRNGAGVAWALSQIDRRNQDNKPANYALLHITSEDQARRALSSLSGEMHVSAQAALMSSGTMLEDAAVGQMRMAFGKRAYASQRALRATMPVVALGLADRSNAGGGMGIWTKSLEFEKRYGGSAGVRSLIYSSSGSLLGFDLPAGDWRAGLFSGTSQAQFAEASGQSSGTSDSYHAGIYGGRMWSEVGLRAGMSYSSHAVRMGRKLSLPGTDNKLNSSYGAHTFAFYSQLDRRIGLGGVVFEPFVGLSHVRQTTEEFVEKGAAGLAIRSEQQQTSTSIVSAGMGISAGFRLGSARMRARGMLAWKHELGSRDMVARQSLGISDSFDVYGARKASDSLEVDAGLDMRLSKDANMSFVYSETDLLETGGRDGYFKAILNFAM